MREMKELDIRSRYSKSLPSARIGMKEMAPMHSSRMGLGTALSQDKLILPLGPVKPLAPVKR